MNSYPINDYSSATFVILILIYGFALLVSIGVFIFQAISFYKIAKCRNLEKPWLAFIPFFNLYLTCKIGDDINAERKVKTNYRKISIAFLITTAVFLIMLIIFIVLTASYSHLNNITRTPQYGLFVLLFLLFYFVFLAFLITIEVFMYISIFRIYQRYNFENATVFTVFSIIFSITLPVFMFITAKRAEKYHKDPIGFEQQNGPCRPYYPFNPYNYYNQKTQNNQYVQYNQHNENPQAYINMMQSQQNQNEIKPDEEIKSQINNSITEDKNDNSNL